MAAVLTEERTRARVTAAGVRLRYARAAVVAAAVVAAAVILWLARSYTFYFDEWEFILGAPAWSAASLLQPHNEHPVILSRLLYAALLSTFGLRTYMPYMAALLGLHVLNVVLVFELLRRRAGELVAAAGAALLVAIGAGWENLLWAFQVTFVGSVTCGLGALVLLDRGPGARRAAIAALLVALSVSFSGIGLCFGVAVAARLLLEPRRRADAAWLVPVAIAVAGWYAVYGRGATPVGTYAANLAALPAYAVWGLASSAGGLAGLAGAPAIAVLAGALIAIAAAWRARPPDALALGVAAGLLGFYALTGLTRAQLGYAQSGAGRYVYVGAVFWVILLADAARLLPWRGTWRPALVACLFLACFNSAVVLFEYSAAKTVQMQRQVADLQALDSMRADRCLDPAATADPLVMPQVNRPALYYRSVDRYGDPVAGVPVTDRADFDAARARLRRAGC